MRTLTVRESRAKPIDISDAQAKALNALGNKLASKSRYWADQGAEQTERSIIRCTFDGNRWWLFVHNAVGIIRVDELQILVAPKIPLAHLVFLMSFSGMLPRFVNEMVLAAESIDFLELIARWFLSAVEDVLRRELTRDYFEIVDTLPAARGQIDPLGTSENYYAGRLSLVCRFDEFDEDIPINRVLKAGLGCVSNNPGFDYSMRRDASLVSRRFDVGMLQAGDLTATTDRRTAYYRDALALAKLLITNEARTIELGGSSAWSFLISTPDPVETGLREVLRENLAAVCDVNNKARPLSPSKLSVNPDLVFDPALGVGDIKYKEYDEEWVRADLYQVVSFAAAYDAHKGAVVSFESHERSAPTVNFGRIEVQHLTWLANPHVTPRSSATKLSDDIRKWLNLHAEVRVAV